jgi:hypothetical protein
MFELIHESGFGAWTTLLFTVAGAAAITTIGLRRRRPGSVAAAWAVVVLASGALGFATGQRKVDQGLRMVMHETPAPTPAPGAETPPPSLHHPGRDPGLAVQMMSRGTREASGNLLLAGACALVLSLVGGVLSVVQREPKTQG